LIERQSGNVEKMTEAKTMRDCLRKKAANACNQFLYTGKKLPGAARWLLAVY